MPTAPSAAVSIADYIDKYADKIVDLMPATAAGDMEAVHDSRAALRRLHALHRGYGRELFPVKKSEVKRAKSIVRHLGTVRDPQVALARLASPPLPQDIRSMPALRRALAESADDSPDRLSPQKLRKRTEDAVSALRLQSATFDDDAAVALLDRQWERCERLRREAEAYEPGAARWTHLHAQRKALKRLRYMAEALESWAGERATSVAEGAEERQETLGALNDCWQLQLWLVDSLNLSGVDEADVVRLLAVEDGILRACDADYRAIAAKPVPQFTSERVPSAGSPHV